MTESNLTNKKIKEALKKLDKLQEELEELRAPKGEVNYFTATAMLTQEIKHSAFIAWLLNPDKEHNLGSVMLERIIERLYKYNNVKNSKVDNIKSNRDILCDTGMDKDELLNACKNGEIAVETEVVSSANKRADLCITLKSGTKKKVFNFS